MEYINRTVLANGEVREVVTFSDSKKKIHRFYQPNGTLVSEVEFASESERTHIEYYPSGAVKARTPYCRNLHHGEVLRLARDGRVLHKSTLT